MKSKLKKYIKEAFIFLIVLFVTSIGVSSYRTSYMKIDDAICKNGKDIVYFWGSWCPVCKITSPNIDHFQSRYNIKTIAVKSGSYKEIAAYMKKNDLSFPVYSDSDGALAQRYAINVFPTTVFCKNDRVKLVEAGYLSAIGIWLRLLF